MNAESGPSRQLPLCLGSPPLARSAVGEAARRGLVIDHESIDERDVRLVGEIGGLIAGLNRAMAEAGAAGIDVMLLAHYQDTGAAPKRCVLTGTMKRLALNMRL